MAKKKPALPPPEAPSGTRYVPLYKRAASGSVLEWHIHVELTPEGHGVLVTRFGAQGGKMQECRDTITAGKNVGKRNETTPYRQAVAEAQSRWYKQLERKGYGVNVEDSALVRAASPMLAQKFDGRAARVDWSLAWAQPKLDGYRCLARVDAKGNVQLTSRENQPITAPAHIMAELAEARGAREVVLDGELYAHGLTLNQIGSACKKASALTDKLGLHVYDVMSAAQYGVRYAALLEVVGDGRYDHVHLVKTVAVSNQEELMVCQKEFLEEGYEGAMLRHGKTGYEAGKRSASLLKVKTFLEDEFKVVDWKMGRGKYAGVPVFTCVTTQGYNFDVLAPGDMAEKRALGVNAAACVGELVTVKYQYFTATEEPVPFHPVAKNFRFAK